MSTERREDIDLITWGRPKYVLEWQMKTGAFISVDSFVKNLRCPSEHRAIVAEDLSDFSRFLQTVVSITKDIRCSWCIER